MDKKNLIVLHGWQSSPQRWQEFKQGIEAEGEINVFVPQLPGFGNDDLSKAWGLFDYLRWLKKFIKEKGLEKYSLLAHSFGGRISILFASRQPSGLEKLLLINSAGIKSKKLVKKKLFYYLAKIGKRIFRLPLLENFFGLARKLLYTLAREKDYYYADQIMRKTMQRVIAEDLRTAAEKITVPTLLLWGKEDRETPLWMGEILQDKIKGSRLLVYKNSGHGLPLNQPKKIINQIWSFLEK